MMLITEAVKHIYLKINSKKNLLVCEIYMNRNRELFHFLQDRKEELEKEIGEKMEYIEAQKSSGIRINKEVSGVFHRDEAEK